MATLEVDDLDSQEYADAVGSSNAKPGQTPPYGMLVPVADGVPVIELRKNQMSFGRERDKDVALDFVFEDTSLSSTLKKTISKEHFKLFREPGTSGQLQTVLLDLSGNGTFVNLELVGKNKKRVMFNNDMISLSVKDRKVFVYLDKDSSTKGVYPAELTKLFIISNKELGRGAMGVVMLAVQRQSNKECALKIITKKKLTENGVHETGPGSSVEQIKREIEIMKSIDHPNVVRVMHVVDEPRTSYIVMEMVHGGELFDRITRPANNGQGLGEALTKFYAYQLMDALSYLHRSNIAHRDLKPENILCGSITDECLVKITDFGLSKLTDGASLMKTYCGTPTYLAPEVVMSEATSSYTSVVDVWSMGVIFFTSIVGYPPFGDEWAKIHGVPLKKQIMTRHIHFTDIWNQHSLQARDMIEKMITVDASKRITAAGCMTHPWFQDDDMIARYGVLLKQFHQESPLAPDNSFTTYLASMSGGSATKRKRKVEAMEVDEVNVVGCSSSSRMKKNAK